MVTLIAVGGVSLLNSGRMFFALFIKTSEDCCENCVNMETSLFFL